MKNKIVRTLFMLLLSGRLFGQSQISGDKGVSPLTVHDVSGIVKDMQGNPINGARILLTSKTDTLKTTTSAWGKFSLIK